VAPDETPISGSSADGVRNETADSDVTHLFSARGTGCPQLGAAAARQKGAEGLNLWQPRLQGGSSQAPFANTTEMSAFTATQMMVSAPVVAKASAASKAKAVAPKGKVSFAAKVGVSNATEKKTNAFYIWKSQNNKCVHVLAVREQQGPGRARAGRVSSFTHFQLGLVPRRLRPLSCCASAELVA